MSLKRAGAGVVAFLVSLLWFCPRALWSDDSPGGLGSKLGGTPGAATTKVTRQEPPAFTEQEAREFLVELLPLVEKVAGRRFKSPPTLKNASVDEVTQSLARDLAPQIQNLQPDLTQAQARSAALAQAKSIAPAMLGKYGFTDQVLYLIPSNVKPLLQLAKVDLKHLKPIVKLVVAHELTHALQDQEVDLTRWLNQAHSPDQSQALSALIEGQAVFVEDEVGRLLGLESAVLDLSRLFSAGAVTLRDPALQLVNKVISTQYEQIYLGGRKFIAFQAQKGGAERLWTIFAHPPISTSMILNPDTYTADHVVIRDYRDALQGLDKLLGDGPWTVQNVALGAVALSAAYANFDQQSRDELLKNIETAQTLIANKPANGPSVSVSLIVMKDAGFPKTAVGILEAFTRKTVEGLRKNSSLTITNLRIEDFPGMKADVSRRLEFDVQDSKKNKAHQQILRIGRGRYLVEIMGQSLALSDDQVVRLADTIFDRVQHEPMP